MTAQTLFTSWQPYSPWEYPGQSGIVAYFSMEIAITPPCLPIVAGLAFLPVTLSEPRRILGFRWLRSRWLTAKAMSSSVWMLTACRARSGSLAEHAEASL
jgi:hypothetical protein